MKKEMIAKYGGIRSRSGKERKEGEGLKERYVDEDIIKGWDNEAREKMKYLKTDEDKAELEKWLDMTDEEKKAAMSTAEGKKKYDTAGNTGAI